MTSRYLKIFIFTLALLATGVSQPVRATGPEAVALFAQAATLDKSGQLNLSDEIDYDFGGTAPHDVTYMIPLSFYDDQGREFRVNFELKSAKVNGVPVTLNPEVTPSRVTITLPAAASQAGPTRRYALTYSLVPIITYGEKADILRLNVTGSGWSVPINRATLHLETPTAPADNLTCYTGAQGSTTSACTVNQEDKKATVVSYAPLKPGEGLTIFCDFPHNSFTNYLKQTEAETDSLSWLPLGLTASVLLVIGLGWMLRRRFARRGRPDYTNANETAKDQANRH